ncbi:MAG: type I-C CRISPR-associated protein Cas5 [Chitinispirillaceae bacterium]|nr:type I-C CRISPR-associated protein Cas5 [Chitinispirillaceae bacterium]
MKDWCLEVWGDYACFTRPEMKVERVSYDIITPSAARAVFEAILWKPAIHWNITRIEIMKPIKWVSVRRNEVGKKFTGPTAKQLSGESNEPMGFFIEEERQQRAGLFLRDVKYRLYGYFDFIEPGDRKNNRATSPELWADAGEEQEFVRADEKPAKYAAMFERRAKKGQCFHRPYLGCREFACDFKLIDPMAEPAGQPPEPDRELGWMLYDMNFENPADPTPMFFKAKIEKGAVITDHRKVEVRG